MKKWFAFDIGANGGISASAVSGPLATREEAEDWARKRLPKTQAAQVAIVELVGIAERISPPVVIKPVLAFSTDVGTCSDEQKAA